MNYGVQSASKDIPNLKKLGYDLEKQIESGLNAASMSRQYSCEWINKYFGVSDRPKTKYGPHDAHITKDQIEAVGYAFETKKFLGFCKFLYKQIDLALEDRVSGFWNPEQLTALIKLAERYNTLSLENYKLAINFAELSKYIKIDPQVTDITRLDVSKIDLAKQYRNNYLNAYKVLGQFIGEIQNLETYIKDYKSTFDLTKKYDSSKLSCLTKKLLCFYEIICAIPAAFNNFIRRGVIEYEKDDFDKRQADYRAKLDAMSPLERHYATHDYTGD